MFIYILPYLNYPNPFNGIERIENYLIGKVIHGFVNPFNGIESALRLLRLLRLGFHYGNPFNGIERVKEAGSSRGGLGHNESIQWN